MQVFSVNSKSLTVYRITLKDNNRVIFFTDLCFISFSYPLEHRFFLIGFIHSIRHVGNNFIHKTLYNTIYTISKRRRLIQYLSHDIQEKFIL